MGWLATEVMAATTAGPIDIADARRQCGVLDATFDEMLSDYILGAAAFIEATTGLRLCAQGAALRCTEWSDLALLPTAPIRSIGSIAYIDEAGAAQVLPAESWSARLAGSTPAIVLAAGATWPARQAGSLITIVVEAGYEDGMVPADLKDVVRLSVAQRFANREFSEEQFLRTVDLLTANHRLWRA